MPESGFEILFQRPAPAGIESSSIASPSSSLHDSASNLVFLSLNDATEELHAHYVSRPVTPVDRLYYRRKSRLSHVHDKIQQPEKVVPEGKLPIWDRLSLSDKIPTPNIPNHRLVWTRGKICQNLHRDPSFFDVGDPYNRRRVISEPYDALHDEATKSYFQCPSVQKLLHEQGLITPSGSVPCTLAQFNNWRKYLYATIQTHKINKALDQIMETKAWNCDQMKSLHDFAQQEENYKRNCHRKQRQATARENQVKVQLETMRRYEAGLKVKEERMNFWKLELTRRELDRIIRMNRLDEKRNSQLAEQRKKELTSRERVIFRIVEKQMEAERRVARREKIQEEQLEEIFENKIQAHSKVQEIENERESHVTEVMEKEAREAVTARKKAFHKQHLKHSYKLKMGKGVEEKKLGLMAKYFDKWTKYAVKRQLERCSSVHSTFFHLPSTLAETLQSINENLGYDPKVQGPAEESKDTLNGKQPSATQLPTKLDSKQIKVREIRKTKSLGGPMKDQRPKTACSLAELEQRKKQQSVGGTMQFILAEARRVATVKKGGFKKGFHDSTGGHGDGGHPGTKSKEKLHEFPPIGGFDQSTPTE